MSDWHGLGGPSPNPAHLGYTEPEPPAVPDSEALSSLPASMLRPDDGAWYDKDDPDDQPSGSGVVPDKPALALCGVLLSEYGCQKPIGHGDAHDSRAWPWPVPAVTDNEAATKVIESAVLLGGREWDRWPTHPKGIQPRFNFIAERVVADLRSAGFLIVHHTKET